MNTNLFASLQQLEPGSQNAGVGAENQLSPFRATMRFNSLVQSVVNVRMVSAVGRGLPGYDRQSVTNRRRLFARVI